jgi:hypothetical protein
MSVFGRGYDRDYDSGYRMSRRYGARGYEGGGYVNQYPGYETDYWYGHRHPYRGPHPGDFADPYGNDYRWGRGREKTRWETDYGDPFGDRLNRTPIRVIRGGPRGYDRGYRGNEMFWDYDGFGQPTPYRPYGRLGYDAGFNQRIIPGWGKFY